MEMTLSPLGHTWIIDIDGTIFKHNSHLTGADELLPGVKMFFQSIPDNDRIILLTAREAKYKDITVKALMLYGLKYDEILFNMPTGERILINDSKPSGLKTAIALDVKRDAEFNLSIYIDHSL